MRKGFTIVELLITVAIIGVLTAIAIPVSMSMVAKSRQAACLSNLSSIGIALQSFVQDNNNRLPVMAIGRSSKSSVEPVLETVLLPYVQNQEVFHCPADSEQFTKTGSSYNWNITQNGRLMNDLNFFGNNDRYHAIPLVSDKESWHPGGTNFLYADSSISSNVRFVTGGEN